MSDDLLTVEKLRAALAAIYAEPSTETYYFFFPESLLDTLGEGVVDQIALPEGYCLQFSAEVKL